jgi:glycosyltransferase involved in cell wall biosynthesis
LISVVIISKDEAGLDETVTELASQFEMLAEPAEIVVIDASAGRLDHIRRRHADTVRWIDFVPPPGVLVSIPHQRNAGVRAAKGDIIVFIDSACVPLGTWLSNLTAPLSKEESVTAGLSRGAQDEQRYKLLGEVDSGVTYLKEAPTLNFAFRREVFDAVGDFDERFTYGSDVDFSWRLNDAGYRICLVPEAVIRHDYGTSRRQRRRSYLYGKARARLYVKHRARRRRVLRDDPMVVVYPLFLLGLPLTLVFPLYPLLLLIPAWRNRSEGIGRVLVDHLWFGAGVLAELAGR